MCSKHRGSDSGPECTLLTTCHARRSFQLPLAKPNAAVMEHDKDWKSVGGKHYPPERLLHQFPPICKGLYYRPTLGVRLHHFLPKFERKGGKYPPLTPRRKTRGLRIRWEPRVLKQNIRRTKARAPCAAPASYACENDAIQVAAGATTRLAVCGKSPKEAAGSSTF